MKYSTYFWMLIACAILFGILALNTSVSSSGACAVFCTISFLLWFSAVMAPDEEKYVQPSKTKIMKK